MDTCSVEGCKNNGFAKGFCVKHYRRFTRYGDPLNGSTYKGSLLRAVESAVSSDTDNCILWPFAMSKGYGRLSVDGKLTGAHREVCRRAHGEPPTTDHEAAHYCKNGQQGCINPRHLRWATRAENAADMVGHGTLLRGENVGVSVLTETQVLEIDRQIKGGAKQRDIAMQMGVTESTISAIKYGKVWGWLTSISAT